MTFSLLSERCRKILVQWHGKQYQHPLGPVNRELYDRVNEVLRLEPEKTLESIYISLANEIRGVSGPTAHEVAEDDEPPLLEHALSILTPQQGKIFKYLLEKKTAGFDTLSTIPGAFNDNPTDEAITKKLKNMRTRINSDEKLVVAINITISSSEAKRRVTLEKL